MEKNQQNRGSTHTSSETRSHQGTTSSDLFLQWGNRKRSRCIKFQQVRDNINNNESAGPVPVLRTTVRVAGSDPQSNTTTNNNHSNGYLNLRQRSASPAAHRILRNCESSIAMRGGHSNVVKGMSSPERGGAQDKKVTNSTTIFRSITNGGVGTASSETAQDGKKGGGSSSGSEAIPAVWPPKFMIALTNKEKEEDFMVLKGSKLPQRPRKRAKFVQRTVNLVSPGEWLCDLTLERYEVREKKVSKKKPRGLKAMDNNMDYESE